MRHILSFDILMIKETAQQRGAGGTVPVESVVQAGATENNKKKKLTSVLLATSKDLDRPKNQREKCMTS